MPGILGYGNTGCLWAYNESEYETVRNRQQKNPERQAVNLTDRKYKAHALREKRIKTLQSNVTVTWEFEIRGITLHHKVRQGWAYKLVRCD